MCATQGLKFLFFLGSQRMPNFALFRVLEDAEISQKQFCLFPLDKFKYMRKYFS